MTAIEKLYNKFKIKNVTVDMVKKAIECGLITFVDFEFTDGHTELMAYIENAGCFNFAYSKTARMSASEYVHNITLEDKVMEVYAALDELGYSCWEDMFDADFDDRDCSDYPYDYPYYEEYMRYANILHKTLS